MRLRGMTKIEEQKKLMEKKEVLLIQDTMIIMRKVCSF